jgi:SAM-dependent methyltransferase
MSGKKKLHSEKAPPKEKRGVALYPQRDTRPVGAKTDHSLPWLFAGTLFLSATLLFLVELLMAKMILPLLGGAPSVWNTCMVFYQAALLAGYAYAHASSAWLSLRHQLLLHMALVVVPVITLPLGITEDWVPPAEGSPVLWLLALLFVSVGLPFFILSASTPLLQKWFSNTDHPAAKDPYFLYAASNLGSILALLGYPTVIEPLLPVKRGHWSQCWLWTIGYVLLIVLVLSCAWAIGKSLDREEKPERRDPGDPVVNGGEAAETRLGILTRLRWIALAFVPSSLMLGVTAYVSLDLAAIPLLWVIPLALYLLSFILVFARWPKRLHNALVLVLPPLLLFLVYTMQTEMVPRIDLMIFLHLLVLFLVALVCHGELALNRPAPRHLTEFYLWLSVGGVLGGFFNALLAPQLFRGIVEYQVGLVLACLLLPGPYTANLSWMARFLPAKLAKPASLLAEVVLAVFVGFIGYKLFQFSHPNLSTSSWLGHLREQLRTQYFAKAARLYAELLKIVVFGVPLLLCYALATRPVGLLLALGRLLRPGRGREPSRSEPLLSYLFVQRPVLLGLGVGTFMLNGLLALNISRDGPILLQIRNFYGVLKVSSATVNGTPQLKLTNGTTSHGAQWYHHEPDVMAGYFAPAVGLWPAPIALNTALRYLAWQETDREPLTYYHRTGPIGQVFEEFSGPRAKKDVAVIGLGAGTLASYGEAGQNFLFFDIDLDVVEIARKLFSYIAMCRAKWDIIPGDARLRMKGAEDKQFQLIIVDAFNSDAIPVHLLTREALQLYFQKLSPDGILALHISNRYLRLEPVLGNLAQDLHLVGMAQYDLDVAGKPGKQPSQWVLLANRREDFGNLAHQPWRWKPIQSRPDVGVWTDDYSNLLSVFKWN